MAPKIVARGIVDRVKRLPLTKARINLGALVKRAHLGNECFILEKDGIPIAGLMGIDEFKDYLAGRSRPRSLLPSGLQQGKGRKAKSVRTRRW